MKTIPVTVTYLQMFAPMGPDVPPPVASAEIVRAEKPTIEFYRFLYDAVGRDWKWIDRQLMSDDDLGQIVHDDRVEVYVLHVDGKPAGYAELDRRIDGDVELAYFGILPEFFGKGLGRYFLHWAIEKAWSGAPRRLWVHTCELDHPAALPLYQKAGFDVYDRKVVDQVVREEE